MNFYQNGKDRLRSPMKRNAEGGYDPIGWDTAISEIASKLGGIRDEHGGDKIFYYGGGGQGNHLPGAYSSSTQSTLGIKYRSNAIAQEKTGEFWVAERMFGGYNHADFENAQVVIFLGKNPWQSHGFHRARAEIREMSKNTNRTLIVIDPKRTETADLADIHLPVKMGRDAWLLAGMVATIVQENLHDDVFIAEHTTGAAAVMSVFHSVDIADCAQKSGIEQAIIRSTARTIAQADSVAILEDLGTQMNRHSTLVSYLQRLISMLTGNFAKPGTAYTSNGLGKVAPALLYRTLGKALPAGMKNAAALWALCHQHAVANRKSVEAAGVTGEGIALGENLFNAILAGPSAVIMSKEQWSDVWQRTPGARVNFDLPEMLAEAANLNTENPQETTTEFPFLLSAGERRDFTANTIFRNPEWRRKDKEGAMYINPDDAARLNLGDGSNARITTAGGALNVVVEINDRMQRGHVSIPNGLGLDYPDEHGNMKTTGAAPNELTSTDLVDKFVGTPWHKSVPVRVEATA